MFPGFKALWNTPQSFDGIIRGHPVVHYIFLSTSLSAYADAHWMKKQVVGRMTQLKVPEPEQNALLERMHFVTTPAYELGNWIPDILKEWRCEDHNCGYYQASFQAESSTVPLSLSTFDCLMHDPNCASRSTLQYKRSSKVSISLPMYRSPLQRAASDGTNSV